MKSVLVTGGTGFIGSHTVVALYEAGYQPIIVDNYSNSSPKVLAGIKQITGEMPINYRHDYQDGEWLTSILKKHDIQAAIHFAAYKAVNESIKKPLDYYQNNVAGMLTLLKTMGEAGAKNLVFSSSCTVYGEPDNLPITEGSPLKPASSPYGASKQMCETIIRDVTNVQNLKSLALRYFNPISAHPSGKIGELPIGVPANLVPFVTQATAGKRQSLTINGDDYPTPDGTCIRDYVHVVDLANAHIKAMEHLFDQKNHYYDAINIGTGKGTSVLEIIKTFEKVNGLAVPHQVGPRRRGDIVEIYANADKASKLLNWQAELSLEDSLRDAWAWQQAQK